MKTDDRPIYQDLERFHVPPDGRGRPKWFIFLWMAVQATLWRWSPRPLYAWRRFLLRLFGGQVGPGTLIRPTTSITYPWNISIGRHSWIGDDCTLYSLDKIEIGSNVSIAHQVYLCTGYHDYSALHFPQLTAPIVIENECWLPNDVFVAPGVTIGKGCVVGARSSVFDSLPAGMICFGTPARPARARMPSAPG